MMGLAVLRREGATGSSRVVRSADIEKNMRNLHIANFVGGLLLGTATTCIVVSGTASALPFAAAVISLGCLSYSLSKTYTAGGESGSLEGRLEFYDVASRAREELIKGIKFASVGFVSGIALKLLLPHFMNASTRLLVVLKQGI